MWCRRFRTFCAAAEPPDWPCCVVAEVFRDAGMIATGIDRLVHYATICGSVMERVSPDARPASKSEWYGAP